MPVSDPQSRPRLSVAHAEAFQSTLRALIDGAGGTWVSGNAGIGKTTFLNDLLARLPISASVLRADAAIGPKALADQISQSIQVLGWRATYARVLLVIDDAESLRRDTLDMLDELSGALSSGTGPLQLLLVSRPEFAARLTANRQDQLAEALARRFILPDLTADEAEAYVTQVAPGLSPRLRQATLAAGEGRPGRIDTLLHQAKERPSRTVGRVAAWSIPAGLVAAGVVGGALWSALRPAPGLPPIALAERAASPPVTPPGPAPALTATASVSAAPQPYPEPATTPAPSDPAGAAWPELAAAAPAPEPAHAAEEPGAAEPSARPLRTATRPAPLDVSGLEPPSSLPLAPPRGLLLLAQPGDTLLTLYQRVYRGTVPPAFVEVLAANPDPIRSGSRVLFPPPPEGWSTRSPLLR